MIKVQQWNGAIETSSYLVLCRSDCLPELLGLEQVEEVKAVGIHDEFCILWALPVLKILQVSNESGILEESVLCEICNGIKRSKRHHSNSWVMRYVVWAMLFKKICWNDLGNMQNRSL
jgi:hypothetical protein